MSEMGCVLSCSSATAVGCLTTQQRMRNYSTPYNNSELLLENFNENPEEPLNVHRLCVSQKSNGLRHGKTTPAAPESQGISRGRGLTAIVDERLSIETGQCRSLVSPCVSTDSIVVATDGTETEVAWEEVRRRVVIEDDVGDPIVCDM